MKNGIIIRKFKRKKNSRMKRSGQLFFYLMLLLPLVQFLIFYVVVNFNNIVLAFKDYEGFGENRHTVFVWFNNFKMIFEKMFNEDLIKISIGNSMMYFGISVLIIMPLTIVFAYYIYKKRFGGEWFKIMLFIPSIISSMIILTLYSNFSDWGLTNYLNVKLSPIQDPDKAALMMVIANIMLGFSGSILLYLNAMSSIPESRIEAAKMDGASEFHTFFHIVLPSIWPTIVSFLLINIAAIGTNQANLYTVYSDLPPSGSNIHTLGYALYIKTIGGGGEPIKANYPYAAACGVLLTLIIAPITLLVRYLLNKFGPNEE